MSDFDTVDWYGFGALGAELDYCLEDAREMNEKRALDRATEIGCPNNQKENYVRGYRWRYKELTSL